MGPYGIADVEHWAIYHREPEVRAAAFRALRAADARVMDTAAKLASDPSPAVRREVAVALRDVPFEKCKSLLLHLADLYEPQDRFYLEAIGIACEGKEEAIYPLLVEQFNGTDP